MSKKKEGVRGGGVRVVLCKDDVNIILLVYPPNDCNAILPNDY